MVVTELIPFYELEHINFLTRKLKKGFINSFSYGLIGNIFTDFGENFEYNIQFKDD